MKKTTTLLIGFSSLVVILMGFSLLQTTLLENQTTEQINQNRSYEENNTFHFPADKPFSVDSEKDNEGEDYNWTAGVDWEGTMKINLGNVRSVHSLNSEILDKKFLASNDINRQMKRLGKGKETTLILYDVTLEGSKLTPKSFSKQHDGEDFMTLNDLFASSEPLYLKGCNYGTSSYNGSNGYKYRIGKKGSITITIGYLADREVEKEGFTICLGATGSEKYLIDVKSPDIEVVK